MALTHYPAHFEERRGCGLDDLEIRDSWNGNWNHNTVWRYCLAGNCQMVLITLRGWAKAETVS